MQCYCCFSETHKPLFNNFFYPTLPKDIKILQYKIENHCKSGEWRSSGWKKAVSEKCKIIENACINNKKGEIILYSDVDIQFFCDKIERELKEELGDFDIKFQNDGIAGFCSGFFVFKVSDFTKTLIKDWHNTLINSNSPCDQPTLNHVLKNYDSRKYGVLSNKYWSYGQISKKVWKPGENIDLNHKIYVHHANWTVGIENKKKMMEEIKRKNQEIKK